MPVAFAAVFGRGKSTPKPKDPGGHESEQSRNKVKGVDGLETGHRYSLRPGSGWEYVLWWDYGETDEVMNPPESRLDGRKAAYRRTKNPHPGIQVEVEKLPEIGF